MARRWEHARWINLLNQANYEWTDECWDTHTSNINNTRSAWSHNGTAIVNVMLVLQQRATLVFCVQILVIRRGRGRTKTLHTRVFSRPTGRLFFITRSPSPLWRHVEELCKTPIYGAAQLWKLSQLAPQLHTNQLILPPAARNKKIKIRPLVQCFFA